MDRWVALPGAVQYFAARIPEDIFRKLVTERVIPSKDIDGVDYIDQEEAERVAQRLDRRQWAHLRGQGLSVTSAAKQYGFNSKTLWNWVNAGHVRVLEEGAYRVLVDLADVAFCAALFALSGRQGRSLFPSSRSPSKPRRVTPRARRGQGAVVPPG